MTQHYKTALGRKNHLLVMCGLWAVISEPLVHGQPSELGVTFRTVYPNVQMQKLWIVAGLEQYWNIRTYIALNK